MSGVNKAIIVGRLGQDPELVGTQGDSTVCKMSVATSREYDGQEHTEWHDIVAFGRTAENCAKYLQKGRQVYIEGRIQTNEWEDNDGNTRYSTEIVARNVQFLSGGSGGGASKGSGGGESSGYGESFEEDDIPF